VYSLGAGAVLIVHLHEPLRIERDVAAFAAEVVGIRPAAHGGEDVGAADLPAVLENDHQIALLRRGAPDPCAQDQLDSLAAEYALQRFRHVGILPIEEVRASLDDGDRGAETAEHLRELTSDVSTAEHDQVPGQ